MGKYKPLTAAQVLVGAGEELGDFPHIVDNTMRCDFQSCERKFLNKHIFKRTGETTSIHLVAGRAFAEGNDVFRKNYYGAKKSFDESLGEGLKALWAEYGLQDGDDKEKWEDSAKSWLRIAQGYIAYWDEYGGKAIGGTPHTGEDGRLCSEMSFTIELDVLHPITGRPLLYHGRCDVIEEIRGALWLVDDKTTGSLGASWAAQWETRSQFMGYLYGFRKEGYELTGAIARGVGLLKTKITHANVPNQYGPHVLEKWWVQVNRDFQRAVDCYNEVGFGYNFSDSCNAFGGCDFKDVCRSKFEHKLLNALAIRVWDPENPEKCPLIMPQD